ncbi:MAG: GNAT family N-acetyltransferase [Actinomycetota bacterium]
MSDADAVSIGFATTDDIADLARLRWELYAEQEAVSGESPESYRDRFERFASNALPSGEWRAWIAREADGSVGAMWLRTVRRVPVPGKRAGPIGYLTNVYVAPEHRNGGLGTRMLERVTSRCRAEGYSEVIVWPTERSRPFYGRGGFERREEPLVLRLVPDGPLEP